MKHIALVFELNENWIGGSYYIRNLISALGRLPEAEQPRITLLSNQSSSVEFAAKTNYPHLSWIKMEQFQKNPEDYPFDALFPWSQPDQNYRTVSWIPDFQELHLPYYFSPAEIATRRSHHRKRFATAGLVVSSHDVKNDVDRFYPAECDNVAVVHFASFDLFDASRLKEVKAQYGLPRSYVMCANQVWVHKNHIVVIKALALLKARGVDVTVCFTGNESDYRVGGYANLLRKMAKDWGVSENVKFLGFIPRDDQLALMKGAAYIIQPSLFEGWSTVIEDAKSMDQFIVASDLDVHKEQLQKSCRFFPRHNPEALAAIMLEYNLEPPIVADAGNYEEARRAFGRDFMAAVEAFLPGSPEANKQRSVSYDDILRISKENLLGAGLAMAVG